MTQPLPGVVIGMSVYDSITPETLLSLWNTRAMVGPHYNMSLYLNQRNSILPLSRAIVAHGFMEETADKWLCFIDADMQWDATAWLKFYAKANAAGPGVYFATCALKQEGEDKPKHAGEMHPNTVPNQSGLIFAKTVGFGMTLIHRSVLVKLQQACMQDGDHGWWHYFWPLREGQGEDAAFSERCRNNRIAMYIDLDFTVNHVGTKLYLAGGSDGKK